MRGFSLVETLVALVVLSLGLLGVAGLFVHGLSSSRSALYRAQAVHLASDMADRIRAEGQAALEHEQLARWLVLVHDTLPGDGVHTPSGTVSVDNSHTPARHTITVTWAEPGMADPGIFVLTVER